MKVAWDIHLPGRQRLHHFGTDFTNADKVKFFAENMGRRLEDREGLRRALDTGVNPSEETRRLAFDTFFGDTLEDMIDSDSKSTRRSRAIRTLAPCSAP